LDPLLGEEGVHKKAVAVTEKLYKNTKLTQVEIHAIEKTLERAKYWVNHYAPDEMKVIITPTVSEEIVQKLSEKQRLGIKLLVEHFASKEWTEQELQNEIFNIGNQTGIKSKIFEAVYLIFFGKPFGPRLAPFLLSLDQDFVVQRLRQVIR
jgi:lysyl-tRNA synthetase class 1